MTIFEKMDIDDLREFSKWLAFFDDPLPDIYAEGQRIRYQLDITIMDILAYRFYNDLFVCPRCTCNSVVKTKEDNLEEYHCYKCQHACTFGSLIDILFEKSPHRRMKRYTYSRESHDN